MISHFCLPRLLLHYTFRLRWKFKFFEQFLTELKLVCGPTNDPTGCCFSPRKVPSFITNHFGLFYCTNNDIFKKNSKHALWLVVATNVTTLLVLFNWIFKIFNQAGICEKFKLYFWIQFIFVEIWNVQFQNTLERERFYRLFTLHLCKFLCWTKKIFILFSSQKDSLWIWMLLNVFFSK